MRVLHTSFSIEKSPQGHTANASSRRVANMEALAGTGMPNWKGASLCTSISNQAVLFDVGEKRVREKIELAACSLLILENKKTKKIRKINLHE